MGDGSVRIEPEELALAFVEVCFSAMEQERSYHDRKISIERYETAMSRVILLAAVLLRNPQAIDIIRCDHGVVEKWLGKILRALAEHVDNDPAAIGSRKGPTSPATPPIS